MLHAFRHALREKFRTKLGTKLSAKISPSHRLRRALIDEKPTHYDHAVLEWVAPQYLQYHKGRLWFVIFALVMAGFAVYGIFTKDYYFAAAIMTFGIVYVLTHRQRPMQVKVILSRHGLKFGNHIYPYNEMKAFWILYNPPLTETINFRIKKRFLCDITIHLMDQNPAHLREFLNEYVPEWQDRQETLSESLIRLLRL